MGHSPLVGYGFGVKIRDQMFLVSSGVRLLRIRLFVKSAVDLFMLQLYPKKGLLQTWGYNEHGQLGRGFSCEGLQRAQVIKAYAKFLDEPPELVKITQVSCGENHSAAISDKGEVYTWGLGALGQLGHSSLQSGDKELLPRRVVALDGKFMRDVACGGVHTCAVTQDGALYAWGSSNIGQLGLGPLSGFFSVTPENGM
ncbi:hypothetical protein MLD38_033853 [Melastoma candidum]|uniref:Uncharacterized protein n=1 Tax=Melastoma candidum TaxID=119954 RepID=A0ACB9MCE2_9MYRT|nr:hypothetical protein MLD38_033853 [Melastoma candidum]